MKTIVFAKPNSPIVKDLKEKGMAFIVGNTDEQGNAIKVLKAMKRITNKGEYKILADETSTRHLEIAKKLGYDEYHAPEVKIPSEAIFREATMVMVDSYNKKIEAETKRIQVEEEKIRIGYEDKMLAMRKEHDAKIKELEQESASFESKKREWEKETDSIKKIKAKLKEQIYG